MSGAICTVCGDAGNPPNALGDCKREGCPFPRQTFARMKRSETFIHVLQDNCDHVFEGFKPFPDGSGGEAACSKCGMGAMTYSMRNAT